MTQVARPASTRAAGSLHLDEVEHRALDTARNRLLATGVIFAFIFLVVAGRLVDLTVLGASPSRSFAKSAATMEKARGDIVDRNGVILATSLPSASVIANPQQIIDADAAVADLARVLPDLDREALRARLAGPSKFEYVRRGLTPEQQQAVNALGIPGLYFKTERRRFYPQGRAVARVPRRSYQYQVCGPAPGSTFNPTAKPLG